MTGELQPGAEEWLVTATIDDVLQALDRQEITSVWLVEQYLRRIAKYNHQGPEINAVLEVNPEALLQAEALDWERQEGKSRGHLHGIPILLKDNIDTGDKLHTSAGSIALANSHAAEDAFLVRRLREAGAIVLGKANMTEWANFMTYDMPNGYSSRGGQVLNPYGPGVLDVGGSSSGSAAGVAAGFAAAAVGTETSGSILSPASANSLVGVKPTLGLVSRTGIIPIAYSQDTAGPIAPSVKAAAYMLQAMAGPDAADVATWRLQHRQPTDYAAALVGATLAGARIGVPRKKFLEGVSDGQLAVFERGIEELRKLGAAVVQLDMGFAAYDEEDINVLLYEFKSAINAYLNKLPADVPVHSLADVISFNMRHAEKALRYDQTLLVEAQHTTGTLTEARYIESRLNDVRSSRSEGIDAALQAHGLDALLFVNNYGAGIAAKAGYPSVTVPAGYTDDGEPVGLTFTGTAFSEAQLLSLAYAYEQGTHHRVQPKL